MSKIDADPHYTVCLLHRNHVWAPPGWNGHRRNDFLSHHGLDLRFDFWKKGMCDLPCGVQTNRWCVCTYRDVMLFFSLPMPLKATRIQHGSSVCHACFLGHCQRERPSRDQHMLVDWVENTLGSGWRKPAHQVIYFDGVIVLWSLPLLVEVCHLHGPRSVCFVVSRFSDWSQVSRSLTTETLAPVSSLNLVSWPLTAISADQCSASHFAPTYPKNGTSISAEICSSVQFYPVVT